MSMPIFYFHVLTPEDLTMRDLIGLNLPDRAAAFEAGQEIAKRYETCSRFGNGTVPGWYVDVTTEDGELCWRLPISAMPLSSG